MVGEIRDEETAEIAVNSALTGHLVFSTLHTNNAAGAFPRLIDLGVNAKIITSAINIAIAQRLVRTLCPHCRKEDSPEPAEKKIIDEALAEISDPTYLEGIQKEKVWTSGGCSECNMTGYIGRIGIYEAIITDQAIENIVRQNPSEREIRAAARPQNLLDMRQDGILKILQGTTSFAELGRVIELEKSD